MANGESPGLNGRYQVDALCDEFEQCIRAGLIPRIEDFLIRVPTHFREHLAGALREVEAELAPGTDSTLLTTPRGAAEATQNQGNANAPAREVAPGSEIGPYQLLQKLGAGGFGEVWLGQRKGALATTQVAVKLPKLSNNNIGSIRGEAQSWVRASGHPNVVPIIEADVYGDVLAIVSEYVAGGTLAEKLKQEHSLAPAQAVEIAIGMLCGLEFLHARGIIHRDLKPANVLLQHGIPRLTDFGLAQAAAEQTGHLAGTPAYMGPEAFGGVCSVRTDLWSAGVVFYEMLTGRVPIQGLQPNALAREIGDPTPVAVPDGIPKALQEVIGRALQKDPAHRYRSASEMRAALSACRRLVSTAPQERDSESVPFHITISITGSMSADASQVRRRLQPLLKPYLGALTTWYTGSNGVVDERAAEVLVAAEQQVFLVGYSPSDLSPRASSLMKRHDLPFIDAQNEDVPPVPDAPSVRDIFFATKSDLVILVWDGKSQGTSTLHRWLQDQHRDHLIVYL